MTIDVQMLLRGQENPAWLASCMKSLHGERINLQIGKHVPGNVNAARMATWDSCSSEFLSFVDPDDEVVPGAFELCLQAVGKLDGVCSLEQCVDSEGEVLFDQEHFGDVLASPKSAHHLLIVRRSVYEKVKPLIRELPYGIEWALAIAAHTGAGLARIPAVAYRWRKHANNSYWADNTPRSFGRDLALALK